MQTSDELKEQLKGGSYLGDGLYVRDEGMHVCLFTCDGVDLHDRIYLDSHVLREFIKWVAKARSLNISITKVVKEEWEGLQDGQG